MPYSRGAVDDQQMRATCPHCQQKTTYDFVGEEIPSGESTFRRIRCCDCEKESWLIKRAPLRCGFGRTFYPDGSIGPRESGKQEPD